MLPPDDLDRIMAVMQAAFDPAYGEAWTRRQVEDALILGSCHYGLVDATAAEPGEGADAAGFFLSRFGFDEEELLLIAIDPAHQRNGLATLLLQRLMVDARARGAARLLLEMRRGNPAESLYHQLGFKLIGERPNYYRAADNQRLDALTFACNLHQ